METGFVLFLGRACSFFSGLICRKRPGNRGTGRLRFQSGFTLAEVLVVGIILVILAAVAIPTYTGYVAGQRAQVVKNLTATAAIAANAFYRRQGRAPVSAEEIRFYLPERFTMEFLPDGKVSVTDNTGSIPVSDTASY
jgi:prepilin-type N-terminal cleavage/methylation domain-containing protein